MHFLQPILFTTILAAAGLASESQDPFVAPSSEESSKLKDILTPEIDKFIKNVLTSWNTPGGVGVAVVQKNSGEHGSWNVETKGYGIAKADGSKVTEDTLFAIGSNSKLFDVIATGLLISNESLEPRISWNTKISSIIPEWELSDPIASAESTIVDLMSHRTGLPRHDVSYSDKESISSVISKLKYLRPSAEFREVWQYNNIMYTVLSHIPQVLLKVPFAQYVKKHIFLPLGLNSTTYSGALAEKSGNLADGFGRDQVNRTEGVFGRGIPRAMPYWNPYGGEDGNMISGPGGVISSAKDVATWLQVLLLLGKNPTTDEQIIPPEVIQKAATGVTVIEQGFASVFPELAPKVYGGGQMVSSYRGHNFIEHGGSTPGFNTQITRLPFDNVGIAVLSNDDAFGALFIEVIKGRIVDELFGLEPIDWNSRLQQAAKEAYKKQKQTLVPRPAEPLPPSVPFTALAGKYRHPTYGTLHLCALPSVEGSPSQSSSCKDLIDELPVRLPGAVDTSVPTFFSRMDKVWLSHIRFQHFTGNLFNISGFYSLSIIDSSKSPISEQIQKEQKYWAYEAEGNAPITIEFAFDEQDGSVKGFGVTGGLWGAGAGIEDPKGETVQERAEIWFDRLFSNSSERVGVSSFLTFLEDWFNFGNVFS